MKPTNLALADMTHSLPAPNSSAPLRRADSIRRTTTLVATWPDGRHGPMRLEGRARDIVTEANGNSFQILANEMLLVDIDENKRLTAITAQHSPSDLYPLVGLNGFAELRHALDEVLIADNAAGRPLYQLVHDITGVLIASDWAWASRPLSNTPKEKARRQGLLEGMAGACVGLAPGTSSQHTDGLYQAKMAALVPPLINPEDPQGWHVFNQHNDEVAFCRARRLDLWQDGDMIILDTSFQDSASTEDREARKGVHEYSVTATFDLNSQKLCSIAATPHLLPFRECPAAVENLQRLVGTGAAELREQVSVQLRKTNGCTHLNDAARALAAAPALIKKLS